MTLPPEPAHRASELLRGGAAHIELPPLRWLWARHGFSAVYTPGAEPYYRLTTGTGATELVPERECGPWPPDTAARQFFARFAPDLCVDLVEVRRLVGWLGHVKFPSGWAASPWLAASDERSLRTALHISRAKLLGEPYLE